MVGGANHNKIKSCPPGGRPTDWGTIILKKFFHCPEGSEPHVRLPTLWGPDKGTGSPPGIWPWSPVGFDYKTSIGLQETETPVFKDTNKTLHTPIMACNHNHLFFSPLATDCKNSTDCEYLFLFWLCNYYVLMIVSWFVNRKIINSISQN